jgi:uracil-DNA glycosylase
LLKYGFARGTYRADPNDGLRLDDCRIANAVRRLPPENKPLPVEFTQCRPFLQVELAVMPKARVLKGAHNQILRALTIRPVNAYPGCMPCRPAWSSPTATTARATTRTPAA